MLACKPILKIPALPHAPGLLPTARATNAVRPLASAHHQVRKLFSGNHRAIRYDRLRGRAIGKTDRQFGKIKRSNWDQNKLIATLADTCSLLSFPPPEADENAVSVDQQRRIGDRGTRGLAMSTELSAAVAYYSRAERSEFMQHHLACSPPTSKRSHSDARLLLHEFSHRINNEFASAIDLVSLAAARSANAEVKAALGAVENQLHNYARLHQALQMPEQGIRIDAGAYLRQLCRAISRSKLDGKGIELVLVERRVLMSSERCWRLGLILSELITNAARHAFNNFTGSIRVELFPSTSFVECRVTDNGKSEANISVGRGLKIVKSLVDSLGGRMKQQFGPRGATSLIVIPLCPSSFEE